MNFGGLTIPLGAAEWPVRAALAPSVADDPCESLDDVIAEIERGEATCWVASEGTEIRAIAVTQIVSGSKAKQCFIRHCAGEGVRDWVHYIDLIGQWAKSQGCDSIELIGRAGWERLLGWERKAVLLRKALT